MSKLTISYRLFYQFLNCYIPLIKDIIFWQNQWDANKKQEREACNADKSLDMNNPNNKDDLKEFNPIWQNIFGTSSGTSYQFINDNQKGGIYFADWIYW